MCYTENSTAPLVQDRDPFLDTILNLYRPEGYEPESWVAFATHTRFYNQEFFNAWSQDDPRLVELREHEASTYGKGARSQRGCRRCRALVR